MTKIKQEKPRPSENDIDKEKLSEDITSEVNSNQGNTEAIKVFETRWRYAVFPAMIAFVILSVFGFYLIYGMLQHMKSLSEDIHRMTALMEKTVPVIGEDISQLNKTITFTMPSIQNKVADLSQSTQSMTKSFSELNETIAITMPGIESNVGDMSVSTQSMASSTKHLDRSTYELNRSISRPMNFMNSMMPFTVDPPPPMRFIQN